MTQTTMPGTTAKPMAKYADAVYGEYTVKQAEQAAAARHDYGFGSRAASKRWTPPQETPVPKDWWKR